MRKDLYFKFLIISYFSEFEWTGLVVRAVKSPTVRLSIQRRPNSRRSVDGRRRWTVDSRQTKRKIWRKWDQSWKKKVGKSYFKKRVLFILDNDALWLRSHLLFMAIRKFRKEVAASNSRMSKVVFFVRTIFND